MNLKENLEKAHDEQEQKAEAKPRFVVRNAAFALLPRPPLEWIVEKMLTAGSVSVFYGEPGSKKTYSLLSLAVCVGLGKPWLGFNTKQGKVLIIDEESGEDRLSLRLAAAIRGELGTEKTEIEYISLAGFKLDEPTDTLIVETLIHERGIRLVVIDALAEITDGDENSKQDTQPVLSAIRKIADRTKAAIVLVHHSNKTGSYRGSSAIKGSVDLMVQVESDNESSWIHFKSVKNRDGEALDWYATATWTESQFYLSELEKKEQPKQRPASERYVLEYIKNHGPTDIDTLKENAEECSPQAALAAAYRLAQQKLVTRVNKGGKGIKAVYDLVNQD